LGVRFRTKASCLNRHGKDDARAAFNAFGSVD
jgi:hypothetical protein